MCLNNLFELCKFKSDEEMKKEFEKNSIDGINQNEINDRSENFISIRVKISKMCTPILLKRCRDIMKKYIAEGVGTMMLTLIACGVAVITGDYIGTSLAFGLVIVAAAYSIGNVSGCHINPAVSISLTVAGKMEVKECIKYIISQIIGALVGSLLLAL